MFGKTNHDPARETLEALRLTLTEKLAMTDESDPAFEQLASRVQHIHKLLASGPKPEEKRGVPPQVWLPVAGQILVTSMLIIADAKGHQITGMLSRAVQIPKT